MFNLEKQGNSVGFVKTEYFDAGDLALECGEKLRNVRIAYETYGTLNPQKTNAVFVFHALTGDSHAAGMHKRNGRKPGWYDLAIGPGKTFDTRKYFVICANVLGGCKGTTGPSSINPRTKKPYGSDFPLISIRDMVAAHKKLVDHLGVKRLFCIVGGSMGGMEVLQWAVDFPDSFDTAIVLAATAKQYPMGVAFHDMGRKMILADPHWKQGDYYSAGAPRKGLSLARQVSHITYLSHDTLERKFGRNKKERHGSRPPKFGTEFEIQSYFNYQGQKFVRRFDANSYLYITNAVDHFDLTSGGEKELCDVFSGLASQPGKKPKFLLVSFTSDWLYPPAHVEELYAGLAEAGVPCVYKKLDLPYGHDAFLVYNNTLGNAMVGFLARERTRRK